MPSQVNRHCHLTPYVLQHTRKQLSLRPPWSGSQTVATSPRPPQLWPSVPKLPPAALLTHSSGRHNPGCCSNTSTPGRYQKLLASGQRTRPDPFVMHACTAHAKTCGDGWFVCTPQLGIAHAPAWVEERLPGLTQRHPVWTSTAVVCHAFSTLLTSWASTSVAVGRHWIFAHSANKIPL